MAVRNSDRQDVLVDVSENATQSNVIDVGQYIRGSFTTPSTLSSTTVTIKVTNTGGSASGATFLDTPRDETGTDLTELTFTVATDKTYKLPIGLFNYNYARFDCGTTETADRTFTVFLGN